jgi:hypothetical protein
VTAPDIADVTPVDLVEVEPEPADLLPHCPAEDHEDGDA